MSSISCLRCCMALLSGLACSANLALPWVYSWAQKTRVIFGRGVNLLRDAHICFGLPSKSLPHPRTNRVSPAETSPSLLQPCCIGVALTPSGAAAVFGDLTNCMCGCHETVWRQHVQGTPRICACSDSLTEAATDVGAWLQYLGRAPRPRGTRV